MTRTPTAARRLPSLAAGRRAPVIVERTDYVSLPVTDLERSIRFYEETLELPRAEGGGSWPEFLTGNVSLYLIDPTNIGGEFTGPHTAYIALRVPDVHQSRAELESKGVGVRGGDLRHGRLPHGVLQGSRRERTDAAPPLRPLSRLRPAAQLGRRP